MKRFRLFGIILISALAAVFAVGCAGSTAEYKNNVRVVYELEGGIYKNSTRAVELYYGFARGGEYAIKSVEDVTTVKIERSGYHIDGWYTSKTETDGAVSYDGKWDFATDKIKVDENGKVSYGGKTGEDNLVRLYARWSANVTYEYNVGYVDAENKFVKVGTVETEWGRSFGRAKYDIAKLENDREGYTSLGRYYKYDAEAADGKGEELSDNFAFEESKENVSLDIVVDYIEGNFRVVRKASDIKSTDSGKNLTLYLMNDIDFGQYDKDGNLKENGTIDLTAYNGVRGNGFKISNFKISVTSLIGTSDNDQFAPDGSEVVRVEISLFGDIDGGEVTDVTFDNVKFDVRAISSRIEKIYFAPLSMRAKNTKFERVVLRVTEFQIDLGPDHELDEEGFINDAGSVYYVGDGVTVSGCETNVCEKTRK